MNITIDQVWTVSSAIWLANDSIKRQIGPIWVKGEIGQFTAAASGHWYFTIKDASSQLRCVLFKHKQPSTVPSLKIGQMIELFGQFNIYGPRGDLQLEGETLRLAGQGTLYEKFMLKKQKLEEQGYFDTIHKKPLPTYPKHIGVVTSLQAAALQDVLSTLARRAPHIPITVFPCSVQGPHSSQEVADAIQAAHTRPTNHRPDVLIVCRGGGSIEDLWAFNEDPVVEAVFKAQIPLISGIGHETDFTLCDFVADIRAATPTAAAELASPDRNAELYRITTLANRLSAQRLSTINKAQQQLDQLTIKLRSPRQLYESRHQQLHLLLSKLHNQWSQKIRSNQSQLALIEQTLLRMKPELNSKQQKLEYLRKACSQQWELKQNHSLNRLTKMRHALGLLDPTLVLQRGYAIMTLPTGQPLSDIHQLQLHSDYQLQLSNGTANIQLSQINHLARPAKSNQSTK